MTELIFERRQELLMRDCDTFRRLKPSTALTMFQDSSEALTEGWGCGLEAMLEQGVGWVAAKAECKVLTRLPEHGETVTVRGWAGRCRVGIYPFHYDILDADGRQAVTCCELWVLSDLKNHSMMSENVPRLELPTPEPEGTSLPRMKPIRIPEMCEHTTRRVQYSETDINGHLTNTRYTDWMLDLVPREFHRTHPMKGLRIDYRAEIYQDEELALEWQLTDDRLCCNGGGRFLAEIYF